MKKNNSFKTFGLSCIGILLMQISVAQQTGSFDRTINFGGNPGWALSYYVPADYNALNKYKLIVGLHGLGDTPQNYRDFMASVAAYAGTNLYNAIIVCPYGGGGVAADQTDFWTVCDTSIITRSITDAMSAYNIDPGDIYLNGFSIGGRAALRYGLLNYQRFRGLELWTPAIQSGNEVNNLTSFTYVWQNGQYIPITISVGGSDTYSYILATANQHLSDVKALVNFRIYYGMGHQPPQTVNDYINENDYLNSAASSYAMNDATVAAIASPFEAVCSTSFNPVIDIQDKGLNNLTSATINYRLDNGAVNTYNWAGNLKRLEKDKVTLPLQSVSSGAHTFMAYTTMPNAVADTTTSNDSMTVAFNSINHGVTNIAEGFEGTTFPPVGWRQTGTDSTWNWKNISIATEFELFGGSAPTGANDQSAASIFFDNEIPNNVGKSYSILTPEVDFTNANSPSLTYDYAYSPYSPDNTDINAATDTLAVNYSTDCGTTWNRLSKKGGLELSTTDGYTSAIPFVPITDEWKHASIDLNLPGLIGQAEVLFSFEDISGWGHMMYLDNISVTAVTGLVNEAKEPVSLNVYPNPNRGSFTLSLHATGNASYSIEVRNMLGQNIYTEKVSGFSGDYSKPLDMTAYGSSVYFVIVKTEHDEIVKKVIVY